jgi:hypothetical protein
MVRALPFSAGSSMNQKGVERSKRITACGHAEIEYRVLGKCSQYSFQTQVSSKHVHWFAVFGTIEPWLIEPFKRLRLTAGRRDKGTARLHRACLKTVTCVMNSECAPMSFINTRKRILFALRCSSSLGSSISACSRAYMSQSFYSVQKKK